MALAKGLVLVEMVSMQALAQRLQGSKALLELDLLLEAAVKLARKGTLEEGEQRVSKRELARESTTALKQAPFLLSSCIPSLSRQVCRFRPRKQSHPRTRR